MPKTADSQWYVEQVADGEVHAHALTATIAQGRSSYQSYAIVQSSLFGKMLVLDGDTQSSALDEGLYHESLVHPACAAVSAPARVLVLGGGEGATLREVLKVQSVVKATMVDIDGEVVSLCRRFLPEWSAGALDDPRAEVVVGDAKAYVESSGERFDVIISDLTEPRDDSPSRDMHTAEFYARIRERLTAGGVFALQASTAGPHNFHLHARMIATLGRVFKSVAPYSVYVPAFDTEWGFALCGSRVPPREAAFAALVDAHSRACGLRYYDAEAHVRMFSLPKFLRDAYAQDAAQGP
ncbi:MAG: fused MFS/spermidine synthase [Candidatus Eremiobacteraeota bacterium]|nr:fused MFS/spermidine synthase [Candidatus Eremiobacteraeota bacterium]MBC5828105.1 fused MFS/spermidine synthase [Candidatus Eremiobacteraeota bacterium]